MPASSASTASLIAEPPIFRTRNDFLPASCLMPASETPRQLRRSTSLSRGHGHKGRDTRVGHVAAREPSGAQLRQSRQRLDGLVGDQRRDSQIDNPQALEPGKLLDAGVADQGVFQGQRREVPVLGDSGDERVGDGGAFEGERGEVFEAEDFLHLGIVHPTAFGGRVEQDDVPLCVLP